MGDDKHVEVVNLAHHSKEAYLQLAWAFGAVGYGSAAAAVDRVLRDVTEVLDTVSKIPDAHGREGSKHAVLVHTRRLGAVYNRTGRFDDDQAARIHAFVADKRSADQVCAL